MFKVHLLIPAALAILLTMTVCEECLFRNQLWHSNSNPKTFHYCDSRTNRTAVGACPPGTGFVRNDTASGCIPWSEWNDACVIKTTNTLVKFTCNETNFGRLQPAIDPEYYFLCSRPFGKAIPLKCPNGKAFYSKNNYLGCFAWDMWRNLTGCLV